MNVVHPAMLLDAVHGVLIGQIMTVFTIAILGIVAGNWSV
jgi:hypothetical protein